VMNFSYLTATEIDEIVQAAGQAGMGINTVRPILLAGLNQGFALALADVGQPMFQLYSDLTKMNTVERLADGSVPLRDWLRGAGSLARQQGRREADIFTKYETQVDAKASGQHALPNPGTLREVINKEAIVHQDDMVDFWFLSAGALAGASVAKLLVPRYEGGAAIFQNGTPRRYNGTGWLITNQLVVTNHHVVNARGQDEPAASDADLLLQGANTVVQFDYDSADEPGDNAEAGKLEAWNPTLDFAILRLKTAVERKPLRIQQQSVVFSDGMYLPLNIIQHPSGFYKRVAFRNNLLTSADDTTIRYFTDTLTGSSGSPVFDDAWRVIALHRGAQPVQGVSFQGRGVAVVNVGTQINAILDYLATHHQALRQEIQV
jgi:endonuclease G, mitochondrial